MSFSAKDRIALVSGANRGIGRAIAETLLANGVEELQARIRELEMKLQSSDVHNSGGRSFLRVFE